MTHLLLDTHALIWFGLDYPTLSGQARDAIRDAEDEVFVSAATAWEITTKFRLGKLPEAAPFVSDIGGSIRNFGFLPLSITVEHAQRSGALPGVHKDPFDRMLVAQALAENLTLVSNETIFDQFGVRRLW